MHLSFIRILFRCDVANILRYVSFVFAKESVECSFFPSMEHIFMITQTFFFCSLSTNRLPLLGCIVRLCQGHNHKPSYQAPYSSSETWRDLFNVTQLMLKAEGTGLEVMNL